MARPNKGERDQMMVYPPRALGDMIRLYADAIEVPHGEYVASVLAEHFRHPYWAAPEVRLTEGGLPQMLDDVALPDYGPDAESWDERDTFVTKPVKALGQIVRTHAGSKGLSLSGAITQILADFHGMDLELQVITGVSKPKTREESEREIARRREGLRAMA